MVRFTERVPLRSKRTPPKFNLATGLVHVMMLFSSASLCLLYLSSHQDGWNCLHLAANGGHLDIVKDLVDQHHMNISAKTKVDYMNQNTTHTCYTFVMHCINPVFLPVLFTLRRISQLF